MTLKAKDYEEVLKDHRRLVRELDEALSGPGRAAKQASLCDLIPHARRLREAVEHLLDTTIPDEGCEECQEIEKLMGWRRDD